MDFSPLTSSIYVCPIILHFHMKCRVQLSLMIKVGTVHSALSVELRYEELLVRSQTGTPCTTCKCCWSIPNLKGSKIKFELESPVCFTGQMCSETAFFYFTVSSKFLQQFSVGVDHSPANVGKHFLM